MENITNYTPLPVNAAIISSILEDLKTPDVTLSERREYMKSIGDDTAKALAYAQQRVVRVYLNWLAHNRALALFEYVQLPKNQMPSLVSFTDQDYNVMEINQNGGRYSDNVVNKDSVAYYGMYQIVTDRIDYPVDSIQAGDVSYSDRVNRRLLYALERKINMDIWALVDAAFGNFPGGTYALDTDITSGTIPTTNTYSMTSEGAFTLPIVKKFARQADQLGVKIQKIILNPVAKGDMYDWPSDYGSGSPAQKDLITERIRDVILNDGEISKFFGHSFEIVIDNTRPLNYAYAIFGPCGYLFDKPDFEKVWHFSEKELITMANKDGMEGVQMKRTIKPLLPAPNRLNFMRVQFKV